MACLGLSKLESWITLHWIDTVHVHARRYEPAAYQRPVPATHATLAPNAVPTLGRHTQTPHAYGVYCATWHQQHRQT